MPTPASSAYGNVDGPTSSTDNAIVRFDGTTGKLIQNSVLIVADTTGALSGFTTGVGITFHGGGTLTGASGALTLTASGTNQTVTLTPSGSGLVRVSAGSGSNVLRVDAAGGQYASVGDHVGSAGLIYLSASTNDVVINSRNNHPINFLTNNTQAFKLDASQNATFSGAIIGTVQALSGAGAVNVTQLTTAYTSTGGAEALTLANGTAGQIKTIIHVVDGGSGVLTPTTKIGFTTITFTNVGDACTLQYTSAGWAIIGIFGAVAA